MASDSQEAAFCVRPWASEWGWVELERARLSPAVPGNK